MLAVKLEPTQGTQGIQVQEHLDFLNLPELWIIGLVILPLVLAFAWWSYGGLSRLEPRTRVILSVLRGAAILCCLLALAQPVYERKSYTTLETQVHVLVDDSASMQRKDTYPDSTQHQELSELIGGVDIAGINRSQLVQRVLARPDGLLDKLGKSHNLRLFRFTRKPLAIHDLSELSARGPRTPLGDALDLHLSTAGTSNVDAVILVSDGQNNAGLSPTEVASKYRAADLAIYTIGVGDPNPPRNIRILPPAGPKEALQDEEVVFDTNVIAEGLADKPVVITLESSLQGSAFVAVSTQSVTLGNDGEPVRVRLIHAFDQPGDYTLRYKVSSFPEETSLEDNTDTRFLRVNGEKIRVLFLDEVPRWEYRYIKNGLMRVDPSIEMQSFMFDASGDFEQEHSPHLPPLHELPRSRDDLFAYHVILIGDVPPERLGATEEERTRWMNLLMQFVEFGGGVGFIYGNENMPERYRNTPVQDLLPVVLEDPYELQRWQHDRSKSFRPVLESSGRPHDITMLSRDLHRNRRLWEEELHGFMVYHPVQQAKAGAEVLLRHPEDSNRFGNRVIAAIGSYPRGRSFFIATDETWRWRLPFGEHYQDTFWRNVVRHLAENRLQRRDDRYELRLDKLLVETGEPVKISLRVRDSEFEPSTRPEAVVFLKSTSKAAERRTLRSVPGELGSYTGSFSMDDPGSIAVQVHNNDNADDTVLAREDLLVKIPDRETTHSSQNRRVLEQIAHNSKGGRYLFLSQAEELLDNFAERQAPVQEVHRDTITLWDRFWVLLTILGLLATEWIIRKRARLV